jgi:hypothetical protein
MKGMVIFMNMQNNPLGDKELLNDSISSQKLISGNYDTYANECVNTQLRDDFLCILYEEHMIQTDLFTEMQNRGFYTVQAADMQQVNQAKQKFSKTF